MSRPVTRRAALRGSVAASLGLVAGACSPAKGNAATPTLSANDRRLVELADAYEALDRRCNEHTAAHRHDLTNAANAEFDVLTSGFGLLEEACAATPADSLAGIIAKARLCRSPTARGCADYNHVESVADDLWRLYTTGRLAHA